MEVSVKEEKSKVKKTCPHGKRKNVCIDCNISKSEQNTNKIECKTISIIENNEITIDVKLDENEEKDKIKTKSKIKKKKFHKMCEHGKRKARCILCLGSEFCIHKKNKYTCISCQGKGICEHQKRKNNCSLCNGSSICIHGRRKRICRDCNGKAYCIHSNIKYICIFCNGKSLCIHKKIKNKCKKCFGKSFCIHNVTKATCLSCKGTQICEHNKLKRRCKKCHGGDLCKSSWCETHGNKKKFQGYCHFCYVHLYPDAEISKNYRTKEKTVADIIIKAFPNFTWIADKKIQDGCSLRRPDLLLDLGSHIIIVEVDENQHQNYDCSCENKRLMQISQDLDFRPIIFIRFNPDGFINKDNEKVKSCWKIGLNGCIAIQSKKQKEWDDKMNSLIESITYWSINQSDKMIEVVQMYYDEITKEDIPEED